MLPSQAWARCPSNYLGSQGPRTPSLARPSTASTATRNMSAWVPSRCTSEATPCPASVAPAGRPSPGPGCYRAMSGLTPERSPSPAPTAAVLLPTAPTCGPTSRPTQMSRSTSARRAPAPSPACPCSTNTKSQAAQGVPADPHSFFCLSRPSPCSGLPQLWKEGPLHPSHCRGISSRAPLPAVMVSGGAEDHFPVCPLGEPQSALWTADGRVAPSGSHCSPASVPELALMCGWACVSKTVWI